MRRVLVLKGGGVRGAIQLDSLRVLERHYGAPICKTFDLIVGTSVGAITGGILALGKISMAEYMEIFLEYFPKIFRKHWYSGLFGPVYNRDLFFDMWNAIFGERQYTMEDCATKFMCTAVNICDSRTHFFKSWDEKDGLEPLALQIAKSFAAPFYFGYFVDYKNRAVWADGGAGDSNTPVDRAYAEVINQGWYREPCEIVILGTGKVDLSIPFDKAKNQGHFKQLLTFMQPTEGGLARIQSTINKVARMQIIAKANPLISFKYFDVDIGREYDGTDKIRYMQQYLGFGRIMAEDLKKNLAEWKVPFF